MKLGAYDFLQKPVDPTRLLDYPCQCRAKATEIELEVARRRPREKPSFRAARWQFPPDAGDSSG